MDDEAKNDPTEPQAEPSLPPWPTPWNCRKPSRPYGIKVKLADKNEWELARAGLGPEWNVLQKWRDVIFDQHVISAEVPVLEIQGAAIFLLRANYEIDDTFARILILQTEPEAIADAVVQALTEVSIERKTFTGWARGSLLANGIEPESVPPNDLPIVLGMLVRLGRAIHPLDWTDSGVAAEKRSGLMGMMQSLKADAKPNGTIPDLDDPAWGPMTDAGPTP